ncbi:MAG: hypothetical protein FJ302_06730 [Planctomycetes bacterium]|nr:hypothetical protein [Planctomycetota bacterium]
MSDIARPGWSRHIEQVLRSKHYTWIAEGLGGAPLEEALVAITADLMHICNRAGLSWEELADRGQRLCEREETDHPQTSHAA